MLSLALLFAVLNSLLAFSGLSILIIGKEKVRKSIDILVPFSAGVLISGALMHLLPEAQELMGREATKIVVLGIFFFFLLERVLKWRHCHLEQCDVHPLSLLVLLGDSVHNFLDGLIIGASFSLSFEVGVIASALVLLHELPQELGDFSLLLYAGMEPKKALIMNFFSQSTCILGVLLHSFFKGLTPIIMALAASSFLYIGASDVVPELHHGRSVTKDAIAFLVGTLIMVVL